MRSKSELRVRDQISDVRFRVFSRYSCSSLTNHYFTFAFFRPEPEPEGAWQTIKSAPKGDGSSFDFMKEMLAAARSDQNTGGIRPGRGGKGPKGGRGDREGGGRGRGRAGGVGNVDGSGTVPPLSAMASPTGGEVRAETPVVAEGPLDAAIPKRDTERAGMTGRGGRNGGGGRGRGGGRGGTVGGRDGGQRRPSFSGNPDVTADAPSADATQRPFGSREGFPPQHAPRHSNARPHPSREGAREGQERQPPADAQVGRAEGGTAARSPQRQRQSKEGGHAQKGGEAHEPRQHAGRSGAARGGNHFGRGGGRGGTASFSHPGAPQPSAEGLLPPPAPGGEGPTIGARHRPPREPRVPQRAPSSRPYNHPDAAAGSGEVAAASVRNVPQAAREIQVPIAQAGEGAGLASESAGSDVFVGQGGGRGRGRGRSGGRGGGRGEEGDVRKEGGMRPPQPRVGGHASHPRQSVHEAPQAVTTAVAATIPPVILAPSDFGAGFGAGTGPALGLMGGGRHPGGGRGRGRGRQPQESRPGE